MSFGNNQPAYNPALTAPAPAPAYTPTRADSTVITAGMTGIRPKSPALSTSFQSLVGGAGGLGRKPATAKRALIGGE
jgi:hypothetical protein